MTKKKNTGVDFETAVGEIFGMYYHKYPTATLERNILMETEFGKREVDVLITVPIHGYSFKIVVEARDFNCKLSIDKIDGFHSKLGDLNVDKGIIVSKLGFSSAAIKKAKALDIGLYSLQDQKAFPDLENVFFLIEEISPIAFEAQFTIETLILRTLPDSFIIRDEININGQNFEESLNKGWAENTINFDLDKKQQDIFIPAIQPPYELKYFVDDRRGVVNTVPLKDLKTNVQLGVRYFIADISSLNKHKVLENIHKGILQFFVNEQSIKDVVNNLKPVTRDFARTFLGIKATIKVKGEAKLRIEGMNIQSGTK